MFEWLWKGIAGMAGVVVFWLGFNATLMRRRMEREKREQDEAMRRMVDKAYQDLLVTRERWAKQLSINTKKRTDFE